MRNNQRIRLSYDVKNYANLGGLNIPRSEEFVIASSALFSCREILTITLTLTSINF